jgi:predicted ATPase
VLTAELENTIDPGARNMIKQLRIENFRSLKTVDINLSELSYICGPNASGKTNLSEALDFLGQAFQRGLSYAVAEKGGFYNMCFRRERRSRGAIQFGLIGEVKEGPFSIEVHVAFSLQTRGQTIRSDFYVENESYHFTLRSANGSGHINIIRFGERYNCFVSESLPSDILERYPMVRYTAEFFKENQFPVEERNLLYAAPQQPFYPLGEELQELASLRVFRINPRTARQSGTPSVLGELGKFGENLPAVLDVLALDYPDIFLQLEDLMKEVIPGLTSLRTRYTASRQMGLFLEEEGFGNPWDAEELSDGTLMSMALFVALLDPRYNCVIIEEPENSLHPWILRKFLDCCQQETAQKQVILTTQSPLVVATAKPENLFLVERRKGMTEIVRAIDRESVLPEMLGRRFLDIGQYWMSGALGAVPVPGPEQENLFGEDK